MVEEKDSEISEAEERRALEVTEEAREEEWANPSFVGDLFMGKLNMDAIMPFPEQSEEDKKAGDELIAKLKPFLAKELDADEVDRTGEIPSKVLEGFKKLGLFGIKIPVEYGGLGLGQYNYGRIIELISSHCGSTAVFLSAHQSIGVPQPLKMFGTDEQKKKFLPRLAKGAISAFALTEPGVGSDPSKMTTTATPTRDGKHFLIKGQKLWISNGPIADILIVMARTPTDNPEKTKITAFIVEKGMEGFSVKHRCSFLGLNGLNNGLLEFQDVRVPRENIIMGEGKGLKLALMTLNTGRLTLPAGSSGVAKQCLAIARKWANERHQWGAPIGRHEAVAEKITAIASDTFAIESVAWLTSAMADKGVADIRLEAAMAKLFSTERLWSIIDETLQVRGGRGYETADSLRGRGEEPMPVERMLRDARINTIIEGTTDIMHLFIAREALDPHMKIARLSPLTGKMDMVAAAKYYVKWYPRLWAVRNHVPEKHMMAGLLYPHLKYVERATRRLARTLFHVMMRYQAKLEKKQRVLGRIVDMGTEIFAMAAAISRAQMLYSRNRSDRTPLELADAFCKRSRRRIRSLHMAVYCNDDASEYELAKKFLHGEFSWLEEGIVSTWRSEVEEKKAEAKAAAAKSVKKMTVKGAVKEEALKKQSDTRKTKKETAKKAAPKMGEKKGTVKKKPAAPKSKKAPVKKASKEPATGKKSVEEGEKKEG
ncbi:MAG: acyl-CoA dehydrogenase family protein [Deltaproteobacteria bacterium]|nr:acyl-CoA dehydrogenase family protein [Deltaproteobacteria bacterium]